MDRIIKLYGRITGISNYDFGKVKIRLLCTEYADKLSTATNFEDCEYCQKTVCVTYEGPAHLSQADYDSFGFNDQVEHSTYGVGSLIENLFVDDMVLVYVGYKKMAERVIIEHVIVSQYGDKKTVELSDFIQRFA
jgi:hypothetical protein